MTVITISRQYGSGGDEIARQICQALGYRLFDKRLVFSTAIEAGLSTMDTLDYSEDSHQVKSFFDRLFRPSTPLFTSRYWKEDLHGIRVQEEISLSEAQVLNLVQKAVIHAYETGQIVIVGRAGQILLKDLPIVFHVRIEAPMEDRIQRVKLWLKQEKGMSFETIETRRAAQDLIDTRDAASSDYLRHHYGIDWADPLLYHMVLNTGKIDLDHATRCIIDTHGLLVHAQHGETVSAGA
jgi:cytidylate kinase